MESGEPNHSRDVPGIKVLSYTRTDQKTSMTTVTGNSAKVFANYRPQGICLVASCTRELREERFLLRGHHVSQYSWQRG